MFYGVKSYFLSSSCDKRGRVYVGLLDISLHEDVLYIRFEEGLAGCMKTEMLVEGDGGDLCV